MIGNPNTIRSPDPVHNAETPPLLRLQLDPNRPAELNLDGGFWPRSRELSMELPALVAALSADLGAIALVGYHRDAWKAAPGRMILGGNDIHLESFVSPDPPTIVVIADSGRCVNLRVVPPDTDAASAAQAMSVATHRSAEADIDGQARRATTAEARSLDEVATRLARLPANSGPGLAALISQWVAEAAEQFNNAPIQVFVPILVEHIVRGRLQNTQA
jgi:Family of unknown function (DUF5994)